MNSLNVAFYSPSIDQTKSSRTNYRDLMVNPTPYYLHGYFKKHYPEHADKIHWLPTILTHLSTEKMVEFINENHIDVLCASIYVWNINQTIRMLVGLKELHARPLKIVIGGPSCDAVKDDWEAKYSFIDHFVVGQGEKAWANLALDFLNVRPLGTDDTNIVHFVKNNNTVEKKYQYEFIRGIHYSPYMECEDLIRELQDFYKDTPLVWPYETQRGCPYHCSFCDWNGGQTNKVQKREEISFINEIDFFVKMKMYNLHISDANFGMWDVDVEIIERLVDHKKNGHDFKIYSYNLDKQVSANHIKIQELMIEFDLSKYWYKMSVQDTNEQVLKNINRPGNWPESRKMGIDLYKKFADSKNVRKIFIELIVGLPGQTVDTFIETLDQIYGNGFIPSTAPFLILNNAPVNYDIDHRQKFKIKDAPVFDIGEYSPQGSTVLEVFNNSSGHFLPKQIVETFSFTEQGYVEMTVLDHLYRKLLSRSKWPAYGLIDVNWHHLKPIIVSLIDTEDFKFIVEQRSINFSKYRINAMDSAQNKILSNGDDLCSLIARNFNKIELSVSKTGMTEEVKNIFFSVWRTYFDALHFLDR